MRLVPIKELKNNSVSAVSVVDGKGRFLIKENERFSARGLETLKKLGINYVYITDQFCFNHGKKMYNIESETIDDCMSRLRQIGDKARKGMTGKSDLENVSKISSEITESILENIDILEIAYQPNRFIEDPLIEETIYVAVMTTVLAGKLGWSKEKMINTCIASLVKDFGLMSPKIPNSSKKDYQQHPRHSYEFLKNNYELNEEILHGVLHHHEYVDQTGYPNNLRGTDISDIGKVISMITFFYEIRMNHNPLFDISGSLENKFRVFKKKFDEDIYEVFINNVALFTLDTMVQLSTMDTAVVITNNIGNPFRPVVKVVRGSAYKGGSIIDLANESKIKIEKIVYYV